MTDNYKNADEGVEVGVSEDAFEQDPVLAQYQTEDEQAKWLRELEASKKEREQTDKVAQEALKRYRDERGSGKSDTRAYNIFFSTTDIKLAALYAHLPKADIKRRFDDADDDTARVASNVLQRVISYELECGDFDTTFKQVIFDAKVPGMGVAWLRLDQDEQQVQVEQPPVVDPMTGMQYPQEHILQSQITHQEACIDYVAWDDFYWAPCKVWTLCPWVARRIPMDKQAIKHRFGDTCPPEVLSNLAFASKPDKSQSLGPKNQIEPTVDVYEFWDKERRLVFWISPGAEIPLDVKQDTNDFEHFFPTPQRPLGRFDTANTQPISDYKLVRGKYVELDELNVRCNELRKALKLNFVYDASNPELKELYATTAENQGIGVKNWAAFMSDKGGLSGSVQFTPLEPIASAFATASAQLDRIKNEIYEVEGISDFVRGAATPYETATATNAKSAQSFGRFAAQQQEVAKYAEELLRMKAHLICRFYTPEQIMKRVGMLPQADMQYVQGAIALLKDDQMRGFRLSVSVDSLQLPNWNTEKAERNELVQAVTAFISQTMPGIQQMPQMGPFAMQLLKFAVAGYKGSKDLEGVIDQGLQQLLQQASQGSDKPAKPSPEEIKAQAQAQRSQTDMAIAQMQEETKRMLAQQDMQFQTFMAQMQANSEALAAQQKAKDQELRQLQLALQAQDNQADHAHRAAVDMVKLSKGDI